MSHRADVPLDALTERENVSSLCRKRRECSPIAAPKFGPTAAGKQPWLRVFIVDIVALYSDSAEIRIKPLPIARKAILLHR
jgi:hypothetical protein